MFSHLYTYEVTLKNILFILMLFSPLSFADVNLASQFGFSSTLPDGWFVLSPEQLKEKTTNEDLKSLGIPETIDKTTLSELFNKIKGGDVEYYYDENYLNKDNKNHFSVQVGPPIYYTSMDEVNQDCADMPAQLKALYGEVVEIFVCSLESSSGRPYFHLAYKVPSIGMSIMHDTIFVNKRYSFEVVGASANDIAGLKRLIAAQQGMIDSISSHLQASQKTK